jgi:hypothetical protein
MRYTLVIISCCFLFSCSDSFINHELKFEKLGDCGNYSQTVNMISNINGERYQFFSCIDDNFNGKNFTLVRRGDSVIVDFPKTAAQKKSLFKLILDVDAKPNYHHIILDGREVTVVPAEK